MIGLGVSSDGAERPWSELEWVVTSLLISTADAFCFFCCVMCTVFLNGLMDERGGGKALVLHAERLTSTDVPKAASCRTA